MNSKSSVAVACFLPSRAKDLSAPLYFHTTDAEYDLSSTHKSQRPPYRRIQVVQFQLITISNTKEQQQSLGNNSDCASGRIKNISSLALKKCWMIGLYISCRGIQIFFIKCHWNTSLDKAQKAKFVTFVTKQLDIMKQNKIDRFNLGLFIVKSKRNRAGK
jgi:hypothetical protein